MSSRPVIVIAGLACETSAFSPARTLAPEFHPLRGHEIIQDYHFIRPGTPLGDAADWRGALIGHALPGGIVTSEAFEELMGEMLTRVAAICKSTTVHGLWFDIHGAMCVAGLDDAEAEMLRRVRNVIGSEVIVSASMDLHGNVSQGLAHQTDLITCYRMAPHEDETETKERACRNLVRSLVEGPLRARPLKAWVSIPILLPGEQTSTRLEPAKGLYALVPEVESKAGVLDAAIWVGYAWADEPRNHAVVMVTGWDRDIVMTSARKLATHFWDCRNDFRFVATTGALAECIDTALLSKFQPFFISDSGDNPTAGGAGDVTWSLARVLSRPEFQRESGPGVIYASMPAPEAIESIVRAGVGATVTVMAGAQVDNTHGGPISMTGRIHAIKHGDRNAVTEAVVQVGSVFVILTKLRKPYHLEKDFTELKLDPRSVHIVMVKIGYLEPELFNMAADWMLALTPGGVDQDLPRLGHRRIQRPMWPFDQPFSESPDLTPRMISPSNKPLE
jgi:microcystin degradation protein MlrC